MLRFFIALIHYVAAAAYAFAATLLLIRHYIMLSLMLICHMLLLYFRHCRYVTLLHAVTVVYARHATAPCYIRC